MSEMTNAEKGRLYGKKLGSYEYPKYGIVGEIRYSTKDKMFHVTTGDMVTEGTTEDEAVKAMNDQIEVTAHLTWYKMMQVSYKNGSDYYSDHSTSLIVNIKRYIIAKRADGKFLKLEPSHHFISRRSDKPTPKNYTMEELFDVPITHEFAVTQLIKPFGHHHLPSDLLDNHPVQYGGLDRTGRHTDGTVYMAYDPVTWEKFKLIIDTIDKARTRIFELLGVDEETGMPPLIEVDLTPSNHFLLAGGSDDSETG